LCADWEARYGYDKIRSLYRENSEVSEKMRIGEITEEQWSEWGPYLDTCVLPVLSVETEKAPWEIAREQMTLEAGIEAIESHFKGRTIVYPTLYYPQLSSDRNKVCELVENFRMKGFRYMILLVMGEITEAREDLRLSLVWNEAMTGEKESDWKQRIMEMWKSAKGGEPWNTA
jgi:23S rRNA (pseudouridine1915-N3)-methyltransferase